jgi:hypothetical protein
MSRAPVGVAEMLSFYITSARYLNFSIVRSGDEKSAETRDFCTIETLLSVAVLTTVKK